MHAIASSSLSLAKVGERTTQFLSPTAAARWKAKRNVVAFFAAAAASIRVHIKIYRGSRALEKKENFPRFSIRESFFPRWVLFTRLRAWWITLNELELKECRSRPTPTKPTQDLPSLFSPSTRLPSSPIKHKREASCVKGILCNFLRTQKLLFGLREEWM